MWIFMLVMMATVCTRKRSEEEGSEQRTLQSCINGSESERRPRSTRKRNRHLSNTQATQATDQPPVDEPKRRGRSINRSAINALENLPEGSKISLTIAPGTKNFVGTSATKFSTECGIVIRSVCPMKYHKWDLVPQYVKNQMYEKIQVRFNLL
ncbi:uncharacterized protein LOC143531956 [Bidens hawaiensis]|uniref:uncharacterized protein LOC143531956 n=1 Tax=Bidens hawaiensis TaxID=980011 RepID=UPI00404A2F33